MSATRLLVLGVVRMRGEAHGYQVRRDLRSWAADSWANVQPGSVYHALKKLARDGLLSDAGAAEPAAGPERAVYRITPDGETEFFALVAEALSRPDRGVDGLSAGVTFLTTLPRADAVALLNHRLVALEGDLASAKHMVDTWATMGKPEHVTELARLWSVAGEGDIRWTRELIGRLEAGEYVMADDGASFGQPPA